MRFAYCFSAFALGVLAEVEDDYSIFDGLYIDPQHPRGHFYVDMEDKVDPETQTRSGTCSGSRVSRVTEDFRVPAKAAKSEDGSKDLIWIDFSSIGGQKDYSGYYHPNTGKGDTGIMFSDGDLWLEFITVQSNQEEFLQ